MPPDYPTDIKISEDDRNIFVDSTGDIATIGGLNNLEQSVAIGVMNATKQFIGSRITGTTVGLLEERVREALNDDPQIKGITSVDIQEFDRGSNTIIMDITTSQDETFTIGVSD